MANPPVKLVLIEQSELRGSGVAGALNHLGVEVDSTDDVAASAAHLAGQGMAIDLQEGTTCCYAVQDKVWVDDPDLVPWEIYTVLADAGEESGMGCSSNDRCMVPATDEFTASATTPTAAFSSC